MDGSHETPEPFYLSSPSSSHASSKIPKLDSPFTPENELARSPQSVQTVYKHLSRYQFESEVSNFVERHNIIEFNSEKYFVLGKSFLNDQRTFFVCWSLADGRRVSVGVIDCELPCTHGIIFKDYLLAIPFKKISNVLLEAFDLTNGFIPCGSFISSTEVYRPSPLDMKESGEPRLYAWADKRILLIDTIRNAPEAVIILLEAETEMNDNGRKKIITFKLLRRLKVKNVLVGGDNHFAPFFSGDQSDQGYFLAVGFQLNTGLNRVSSMVASVNLSSGAIRLFNPQRLTCSVKKNFYSPSERHRIIYLVVCTSKGYENPEPRFQSNEGDDEFMDANFIPGLEVGEVILFTNKGKLIKIGQEVQEQQLSMKDKKKYLCYKDENYILTEAIARGDRLFLLHQPDLEEKQLSCFQISTLKPQWRTSLSSVPPLILSQRQMLLSGFGHVLLAQQDHLMLFSQETGSLTGSFALRPTPQALPEATSEDEDPQKSPYALGQQGLWDAASLSHGPAAPAILIVHDVERLAPLVFDIIRM